MKEDRRTISKSIKLSIFGCGCFILFALASIWFGYYVLRHHTENHWPVPLTIISIAGVLLLWEMVKSFSFSVDIPEDYRLISAEEYPELFVIIREVTDNLRLSQIERVYLSSDATAAVFIQPQLRNLILEPKRNLVIGMGFLTQMNDDEIRAVLYHEFGHYVQTEMKSSVSVYVVGQFSRSFVSAKEMKMESTWQQQVKFQLALFTLFTIGFCNRINRQYARLSKLMEYDADDVAARYVGAETLQKALLHAACVRYNYEVVHWGLQQLKPMNIRVDNVYLALSQVGVYSRPSRNLLSAEVVKRVERLGELKPVSASDSSGNVRNRAMRMVEPIENKAKLCSALHFARWLREGFAIYTKQRMSDTAVSLEIHLDHKKHKLPWVDASYNILLDGKEIGAGNYIKGFSLKRRTSPGKHILTAFAPVGIVSTPFEFEVEADRFYRIEMDYKVCLKDGTYDVFGERITLIDSAS